MSLWTTLSIARQGIATAQLGLQITGQNVANVNTEGYRRQKIDQVNMPLGLGVQVQAIERILNPLAERRLVSTTTTAARAAETSSAYLQLENLFNEVANRGLDAEFQDFFQALQDLSARPGGQAERATLRSRGESVGNIFEFLNLEMKEQVKTQDVAIDSMVSQANEIIKTVASMNREIAVNINNDLGINELLNNRDKLVRELAEILPVSTIEDSKGNFQLFIKSGMPLVSGTEAYSLEARRNTTNDLKRDIFWVADTGQEMEITDSIQTGGLGAALEIRDQIVPEQMAKLDRLAAEFVLSFNEQHRAGMGLDGVAGRDFFEQLPVFTHVGKDSQGGVSVNETLTSVVDESLLTLDDYEIRFTGAASYDVVNLGTGATVITGGAFNSGVPNTIVFDGISVNLGNLGASPPPVAGDFFEVSVVNDAADNVRISSDLQTSVNVIAAGFTGQPGDNQNSLLLANFETEKIMEGSSLSFRQFYQKMLVELGVAASSENFANETQVSTLSQINNLVESVSGVSLDEETTHLMAFQRAFQASSKVISIVDEMLETVIRMI